MIAIPLGMILAVGLYHIFQGLMFLCWPSLQAFFRFQSQGNSGGVYVEPERDETTREG